MLDVANCHQQEGLDGIELSYDREIAQFNDRNLLGCMLPICVSTVLSHHLDKLLATT
jgi:hypothetical protein